ncbi:hypothetical protein ACH5RR_037455 [Cinchona calisaya]|uniref:Uncharacterized protein n=1 Tax=Cinchona calisaya TaxID=153742 RepID=A0ABD2Y8H4_9GENT
MVYSRSKQVMLQQRKEKEKRKKEGVSRRKGRLGETSANTDSSSTWKNLYAALKTQSDRAGEMLQQEHLMETSEGMGMARTRKCDDGGSFGNQTGYGSSKERMVEENRFGI